MCACVRARVCLCVHVCGCVCVCVCVCGCLLPGLDRSEGKAAKRQGAPTGEQTQGHRETGAGRALTRSEALVLRSTESLRSASSRAVRSASLPPPRPASRSVPPPPRRHDPRPVECSVQCRRHRAHSDPVQCPARPVYTRPVYTRTKRRPCTQLLCTSLQYARDGRVHGLLGCAVGASQGADGHLVRPAF